MRFGRRLAAALMVGGVLATPVLEAADYALDPEHSNVQFSVPLLAVSKVSGKFMRYDVRLVAGKARDLSQAKVTAVIDTASVDTGSDSWDGKLRTPAFFDAAKYPEIRFESQRVRKAGAKWSAAGSLTIHGVTRQVTVPFEIRGKFDGPHPDDRVGIQATFSFDRREYGMAWTDNPEAKVVGNTVTVDIVLLATRVASKKR
ncbi:MAG TPA: YceI family protein [Thermoanaerobaculia bacterium]|jgi:polyisoprenoid-binding protein YceI